MKVIPFAPNLFRGSRPEEFQDMHSLKRLGVKTILDLEARRDNVGVKWAVENGITRLQLCLSPAFPPKREDVDLALEILSAEDLFPIFMHCRKGVDRTGFIVACYRIRKQGLRVQEAADEMKRMGNSWWLAWWRCFLHDVA